MGSFEDIWREQCEAARNTQIRYGHESAFEYLVGEKLLQYVTTAQSHPEFARLLPAFVGEVRRIFPSDAVGPTLDALEARLVLTAQENDELFPDEPNGARSNLQALRQVSKLLRGPTLSTA